MTDRTSIDTRRTIPVPGIGDPALVLTPARRGVFLCNRHDIVGVALVEYGEWAEPETTLVTALLKPGDTVIECGAHIGTMSIPMARAVGARGAIHALELQPYMVRLLQANLALNGMQQVFVRNIAVGRAAGMMRLPPIPYDRPGNFAGLSFAELPTDGSGSGFPVAVRPLDDMFRDLARLQLLKMDIENMEPMALEGAAALVARLKPIVYCEVRTATVFASVRDRLGPAGYRLYWHAFRGYSADNYRGNPTNRFGVQGDVNLLALPPGMGEALPGLIPARDFAEVERHWPGILGPAPSVPTV